MVGKAAHDQRRENPHQSGLQGGGACGSGGLTGKRMALKEYGGGWVSKLRHWVYHTAGIGAHRDWGGSREWTNSNMTFIV